MASDPPLHHGLATLLNNLFWNCDLPPPPPLTQPSWQLIKNVCSRSILSMDRRSRLGKKIVKVLMTFLSLASTDGSQHSSSSSSPFMIFWTLTNKAKLSDIFVIWTITCFFSFLCKPPSSTPSDHLTINVSEARVGASDPRANGFGKPCQITHVWSLWTK